MPRKAFEAAAAAPALAGAQAGRSGASLAQLKLLTNAPDADDERAEASEEDVAAQDEAVMESELVDRFDSFGEAKMELFDYIEVFYNQRRRHSTLGQISPAAFERRATAA